MTAWRDDRCELAAWLRGPCVRAEPGIAWLGQAGVVVRDRAVGAVIDPYLSDALAEKYRGTAVPHERLMPPPIQPEELTGLDVVLCTHAHTDHMDPQTLPRLAAVNPACRFIVPRAAAATALARGVPAERLVSINAGETHVVREELTVRAIPAAHEELLTDAAGNHHYLGYVLYLSAATIYHAGDCVPFVGLESALGHGDIDVAILPVNGRDAWRRERGIPGNFTYAEAVALCRACGIPALMVCHFGMFDFNTVDVAWLDAQIARETEALRCVRPEVHHVYYLRHHHGTKIDVDRVRTLPAARDGS